VPDLDEKTAARAGQRDTPLGVCPVPSRYPAPPIRDIAGQCPVLSRSVPHEREGRFEFDDGMTRPAAEAHAFETCIVEWLNRNLTPSPTGRYAWCAKLESDGASILPFGTEPGTHAWLHGECWRPWHQARRAEAMKALCRIGILSDAAQNESLT
jgi:hypothetical protein